MTLKDRLVRDVAVCHLGRADYRDTWDLQKRVQTRLVVAKKSRVSRELDHVVLTVEHPPVFTLGKSGDQGNLLATPQHLQEIGATFVKIDRGGDITFHGPGQLVVYPILDLDHFYTDIHRYLRDLEETVILTCADFGVDAGRMEGRTGVWVGRDEHRSERKICAMGIKCSRWVTSHGLALNVATDLGYFRHIVPCGIDDRDVTSLARELSRPIEIAEVVPVFVEKFSDVFGVATTEYAGEAADSYLSAYLGDRVNT